MSLIKSLILSVSETQEPQEQTNNFSASLLLLHHINERSTVALCFLVFLCRSTRWAEQGADQPYIKKPPNAFMLFMKEWRSKVTAECNITESAVVNKILGSWVGLNKGTNLHLVVCICECRAVVISLARACLYLCVSVCVCVYWLKVCCHVSTVEKLVVSGEVQVHLSS